MMDTCLLLAPVTRPEPSYTGGLHRGEVAQLVEHTAENRGVAGSSPALATGFAAQHGIPEWGFRSRSRAKHLKAASRGAASPAPPRLVT